MFYLEVYGLDGRVRSHVPGGVELSQCALHTTTHYYTNKTAHCTNHWTLHNNFTTPFTLDWALTTAHCTLPSDHCTVHCTLQFPLDGPVQTWPSSHLSTKVSRWGFSLTSLSTVSPVLDVFWNWGEMRSFNLSNWQDIKSSRIPRLGIHKQTNACRSVPRSQTKHLTFQTRHSLYIPR